MFFILNFYKSFLHNRQNNTLYYLILPIGLPPVDLAHIKFWILFFCFIFYFFVFIDLIIFWWFKLLPRESMRRMQQKGWFWSSLYSLRIFGFNFLKRLLYKHGSTVFDAFYYTLLCIVIFFVTCAPRWGQYFLILFYNYLTDTRRYLRFFKKWYDFFYFNYIKYYKYYIKYSTICSIFIRPYFAVFFAKYGLIFELPLMFYKLVISQTLIFNFKLITYLLPTFVTITSFIFILIVIWYFLYQTLFFNIIFKLYTICNITFPRLNISSFPQKINSNIEFRHTKQLTLPIYVNTKVLIGFKTINFWASSKALKMTIINRRKVFKPTPIAKGRIRWPLNYYFTNKLIFLDSIQAPFTKYIDRQFNLDHNINSYKLYNSIFKRQLFLPYMVNLKLNHNSILTKNVFIEKKSSSVFHHLLPYHSKIFLKESNKVVFNLIDQKSFFQLPRASNFFEHEFYQYKISENLILSRLKTLVSEKIDHRFIFANGFFRYKRFLKPKTFSRSSISLKSNKFFELNQIYKINSFFSRKNKLYSNTRLKKTIVNHNLRVFKSRRALFAFSARLKLFLHNKNNLDVKPEQFRIYSEVNDNGFKPLSFSNRNNIVLRKTFVLFKRVTLDYLRVKFIKKYFNSTRFLRLFFFILKNRRSFNFLIKNIFFLRLLNTSNLKFLLNLKFNKNFKQVYIPFASIRDYPWWVDYSNLLKSNLFNPQFLMYYNHIAKFNNKYFDFLSNLNLTYRLETKIFAKRIGGRLRVMGLNNGLTGCYNFQSLIKLFYLNRNRFKIRKNRNLRRLKKLYKILYKRKSLRIRFFFDSSTYNKVHTVNGFLSIKPNNKKSIVNYLKTNFTFLLFLLVFWCLFYIDFVTISF